MAIGEIPRSVIARLFSPRVVADLSSPNTRLVDDKVRSILEMAFPTGKPGSLTSAFELAHSVLVQSYRSEYVYKNALISRIIFGRHRPWTASALLELPTGSSILDLAVFNGTSTAYEIKTDMDGFSRLGAQVLDYAKCFEHVNVVTSVERASLALAVVPDFVGVLGLHRSGRISTIRASLGGIRRLEQGAIFQQLRRGEALAILRETTGYEIDVPPGDLWERSRQLFEALPIEVASSKSVEHLRKRGTRAGTIASDVRFPPSLRAAVYEAELSQSAQVRLLTLLSTFAPPMRGSGGRTGGG